MTHQEHKKLLGLIKKWRKEVRALEKWVYENRAHAGHSNTPEGTGDEGWRKLCESNAEVWAIANAARELEHLVEKFEIDP